MRLEEKTRFMISNRGILILCTTGILCSCVKNTDTDHTLIYGKWKLTEVLLDPVERSGSFQNVTSNKILEFYQDGTLKSNGILCDLSIHTDSSTMGTFSLEDSTISCDGSSNFGSIIGIQQIGFTLLLHYACDGSCIMKYKKLY
jgi:hypothetical protein